jgi:hypothetical protein
MMRGNAMNFKSTSIANDKARNKYRNSFPFHLNDFIFKEKSGISEINRSENTMVIKSKNHGDRARLVKMLLFNAISFSAP